MATISLYVPDQEPMALDLTGHDQITVGRGPDNSIVLDHVSLSGEHAIITNVDGAYQIKDLGSTNGTFVEGEQITEAPIGNGSNIMFGEVQAVFEDGSGEIADAGSGGSGYEASQSAELADSSSRPSGFANMSPIEKVEKKDSIGQIAMILGIVAIIAAIAVAALAFTMKAA